MVSPLDFIVGVLENATWSGLATWWRHATGRTIKITVAVALRDPVQRSDGILSYEVRGTLKHLPADHKVWLFIKDGLGEEVKPQGFKEAVHNNDTGLWEGWINGTGRKRATIIAVVAPPTSRDFFAYYQNHGGKTGFHGLARLPPECKNRAEVTLDDAGHLPGARRNCRGVPMLLDLCP